MTFCTINRALEQAATFQVKRQGTRGRLKSMEWCQGNEAIYHGLLQHERSECEAALQAYLGHLLGQTVEQDGEGDETC